MIEVALIIVLLVGGMAVVATAVSLVRVIIGVEMAVMAGILGAAISEDISLVAIASVAGVAETVLMAATLFKMAKEGYV